MFFLYSFTNAQNLVGNPSFETTSGCGGNGQMPQATGWSAPPGGITIADLYTPCASTGVTCSNFNTAGSMAGCSNPCTGDKYTGQIAYYTACTNCREYLRRQLVSPLVAGTTYFLSFHTKLAPYARYGVNRMGMHVATTSLAQPSSNQPILVTPQIEAGLITDKVNWTQVSGTFVAAGGENYVTIGVNYNNASLTIFNFGSSASSCALANAAAYYLVDNVWIAPVAAGLPPTCAPNSTTCPVILPIHLLNFSAVFSNDIVNLNWTTASETDNNFFTVERSIDGINFEKLNTINSKGKFNQSYQTSDINPHKGVSYYRLKQTDFNNSFSYSNIQAVNSDEALLELNVMPNPAEDKIAVTFNSNNNLISILEVYDILNKLVFKKEIEIVSGNNFHELDLTTLNKGLYFVRLQGNESIRQIKFIKN